LLRARPAISNDDTAVVLLPRKEYVQLYSTSQPRAASRFRCQCLRTYTESLSEFGGRRNRSVTLELLTIPYRLQLKHRRQHNKSPTDSNSSPSSVDLTGPRSVRTRLTWDILGRAKRTKKEGEAKCLAGLVRSVHFPNAAHAATSFSFSSFLFCLLPSHRRAVGSWWAGGVRPLPLRYVLRRRRRTIPVAARVGKPAGPHRRDPQVPDPNLNPALRLLQPA